MNSSQNNEIASELEQLVDSVEKLEENLIRQFESSDEEDLTSDKFKNKIMKSQNISQNSISENEISMTASDVSYNSSLSPKSPNKMVDVLLHLQDRMQKELNGSEDGDDWENDDDNGYMICTVSEEEFLEYDQVPFILFLYCFLIFI